MTPEQLQELSNSIAGQLNGPPWWSYLLMLAFGAVGAFFGAYLKKRAENYATKEDFKQVLEQQRQSTEAVEDIKQVLLSRSWVKQRQWEAKERHLSNLLRELAALELMLHYLLHTAYSLKDVPADDPRRTPEQLKRFNDTRDDSIARLRVIAEAIGAAEMYLPEDVVDPVRTLLRNEFESSTDGGLEVGLARAKEWIHEIGVVRASVLAVGRIGGAGGGTASAATSTTYAAGGGGIGGAGGVNSTTIVGAGGGAGEAGTTTYGGASSVGVGRGLLTAFEDPLLAGAIGPRTNASVPPFSGAGGFGSIGGDFGGGSGNRLASPQAGYAGGLMGGGGGNAQSSGTTATGGDGGYGGGGGGVTRSGGAATQTNGGAAFCFLYY